MRSPNPIAPWPKCPKCGGFVIALKKRGGDIVPVARRRFAVHLDRMVPSCGLPPEAYAQLSDLFARRYAAGAQLAREDAAFLAGVPAETVHLGLWARVLRAIGVRR